MTDADLKKQLSALPSPAPASTAPERALHHALIALAQPRGGTVHAGHAGEHRGRALLSWSALTMGVIMLFTGVILLRMQFAGTATAGSDTPTVVSTETDLQTLAEVEGLFPGQLNAVIERDGVVQLDLAGSAHSLADKQPLILHLEGGGHRLRVLSYSGRSVTLELKSGRVTFEALITGDGNVVLSGNDFAWTSEQPRPLAGYRVQAHTLPSSL